MRLAIMQPYFFPYIGYFELIRAVDVFVLLTTVQYIRKGWVNRNRVRRKDSWGYITVPVLHQPRGTKIRDIKIDNSTAWKKRILKTLRCTYKRAEEHPLYQCLKSQEEEMLSPILCNTLKFTAHYLGLSTEFVESSPSHERSQELILSVCKDFGATTYINLPGGMGLYDETQFAKNAVELKFMKPTSHPNTLSILDLCLGDGYHAMD